MNPLTLLLVEDDPVHLDFTTRLLGSCNTPRFDIHASTSLGEAIAVLRSDQHVDAVVLDLHLPDSSGFDTYHALQNLRPELPVVILSGLDDNELALRLVKAGAQEYLVKGQVNGNQLARSPRHAVERKTILERLITSQLSLSRAEQLESIRRLAAGAAHEVKNPLAQMQMALDYLKRHHAESDSLMPRLLATMTGAIERADSVISRLVDFSNDTHLDMGCSRMGDVVDTALGSFANHFSSTDIRLERANEADERRIPCDFPHLVRAFEHVLSNAIQAMNGKGILTVATNLEVLAAHAEDRGTHVIQPLHTGDTVLVATVSDTGPGIPEADLHRVFDPFYTTRATGQGAGLGLAVARKMMDLHGGLVEISNRPTGGCAVRLTLAPMTG